MILKKKKDSNIMGCCGGVFFSLVWQLVLAERSNYWCLRLEALALHVLNYMVLPKVINLVCDISCLF